MSRVGLLAPTSLSPYSEDAFLQGLRDLGYVDGANIALERRYPAEQSEGLAELAAELVQLPVDVIVAPGTPEALAAKRVTSTIPIVFVVSADPVGLGLVDALAHPGGNVTGLSNANTVLAQKRLEFLKEVAPQTVRVACLYDRADPSSAGPLSNLTDAAGLLGVALEPFGVQTADDFDGAFEAVRRLPADALITATGGFLFVHAARVVDFAARNRLPAMYHARQFVVDGGLMCFSSIDAVQWTRAAYYVDRILKGARPTDLPVEQPMRFSLVVNTKTAQALGLTIPEHVLLQATEVIQ
jgi:putative ABC transport system substrate-binding protein